MKRQAAAIFLTISTSAAAFAQDVECRASFALENGNGHFTGLSLFNFGQHFELQADTPSQKTADQFVAAIDGSALDIHVSPGLDDLLVGLSTDPSNFEVSSELLDQLAKGSRFTLSAKAEGNTVRSEFSLKGSAAAIRRLKAGCK